MAKTRAKRPPVAEGGDPPAIPVGHTPAVAEPSAPGGLSDPIPAPAHPLRLEYRSPAELAENPANWRRHPETQLAALSDVLGEVGWAGACLFNERTGRLIDGHARREVAIEKGEELVPVIIGSWTEEQERLILASLDPLAKMAEADAAALDALLNTIETESDAITDMLEDLAADEGLRPDGKEKPDAEIAEAYAVYIPCETEQEQGAIIADLMANNLPARAMTVPKITREKKEPEPISLKVGERLITRECGITRTPRVVQVEGIFDMSPAKKAKREWRVNLTLDKPWQVGLIVGPSGSGKSTIARELFGDKLVSGWPWPENGALIDGFPGSMQASEITGLLSSVGLSSPPSWMKPFAVLSNGEQFRANLARTLAEQPDIAVVDEFTSVVDRTVAKIGSAAVAKCVRASGRRFVAVSCHTDIEEWLQPDWKYDVAAGKLTWRLLQRRPEIQLQIRKASKSLWPLFGRHHYLNTSVHKGSRCFVGEVNGQPAAFVAVLHSPGRVSFWREHRCVCLPDFQGVGIGNAMSEFVASLFVGHGKGYRSTTSHPSMIAHRNRSHLWRTCRAPSQNTARQTGTGFGHFEDAQAFDRLTASFEYVGPPRPEEAARFGINTPSRPNASNSEREQLRCASRAGLSP